jgi:L-lactate dehydrogenase complex protein LldE
MRIGLFIPCYIDAFFPEVGIATLELLERFGHEVAYPRDQTCCGQPMANSGFNADCADTEALFVRNFSGFDYVVAPSGSCVHHSGGLKGLGREAELLRTGIVRSAARWLGARR